ncbi:MAG: hypothetical protein AAB795_00560 [Patescibacteria group bacterium]
MTSSYRLEIHFEKNDEEGDKGAINAAEAIISALNCFPCDVVIPTGFNLLKFQKGKQIPWQPINVWKK